MLFAITPGFMQTAVVIQPQLLGNTSTSAVKTRPFKKCSKPVMALLNVVAILLYLVAEHAREVN